MPKSVTRPLSCVIGAAITLAAGTYVGIIIECTMSYVILMDMPYEYKFNIY